MNINRRRVVIFSMLITLVLVIYRYWGLAERIIYTLFDASKPFIVGAMIAYIVNILMDGYELLYDRVFKKAKSPKLKRQVSLLLAYGTFAVAVAFILGIVIPELIKAVQSLLTIDIKVIQTIFEKIEDNQLIRQIISISQGSSDTNVDISETITSYVQQLLMTIGDILLGILTSATGIFSTVINVFMSIVFSIYVLLGKETLAIQFKKLMMAYAPNAYIPLVNVAGIFNQSFRGFFISQTIEAVILGTLCFIGMLIFNFPFASTISILTGSANMIPILGAYLGGMVGFILILTTSFSKAVFFIVFIIVLQQIESNLIYPRVVGESVGLPAMWVLLVVSLGGALGGVFGMLVAVPIAAGMYRLLKIDVYQRIITEEESNE